MSILGSLARVSPGLVEELRSPAAWPYGVLSEHETQVDLERYWDVLRFLLDEAGAPFNPMRSGRLYPSAERAWGYDGNSCLLTVEEVRKVWHFLELMPFSAVAIHLGAAKDASLYPDRDWDRPITQYWVERSYDAMVELVREAAAAGDCTIFWAA
ncbi:DUF1877 family protein [Plantactinospora sp. S1510]|uniref:DUF1877 family protein n=1 Tax=Plantactinospora alkalitolerans TaxID=2789879 RepID=A0ABS0H1A3_9ACTN|nr:DUF1877 family protein [Plantactinospora alkalitolerans]MBF9131907.1 DUF1877 family protein [Plantactinospora alkalitolerans]